jgi:hypothetical protein
MRIPNLCMPPVGVSIYRCSHILHARWRTFEASSAAAALIAHRPHIGCSAPSLSAADAPRRTDQRSSGVKAIYPDNGNGNREAVPAAVPGVRPETEDEADVTSRTLEVDGEMFALRPGTFGGTGYTWLSGPNPGYGFSMSPTPNLSLDEHRKMIRDFLAMVDPATGYIEDD